MIKVKCQRKGCDNEFETWPYLLKAGCGKYCSKECRYESMKKSEDHKRNGNNRRAKKWRKNHPGYSSKKNVKTYKSEWYNKNKESILKKRKDKYKNEKEKFKEYKLKNKEKISLYNKEYMKTETARASVRNCQHKRRMIEVFSDITSEWLKEQKNIAKFCPICNNLMDKDGRKMSGKTLDHIINISKEGEHKKNNVWYICRKCNLSRPKDNSDVKRILSIILEKETYLKEFEKGEIVEHLKNYIEF